MHIILTPFGNVLKAISPSNTSWKMPGNMRGTLVPMHVCAIHSISIRNVRLSMPIMIVVAPLREKEKRYRKNVQGISSRESRIGQEKPPHYGQEMLDGPTSENTRKKCSNFLIKNVFQLNLHNVKSITKNGLLLELTLQNIYLLNI